MVGVGRKGRRQKAEGKMNANGKKAEGNPEKDGLLRRKGSSQKHVFLRNEPDWKTVSCECNRHGCNELGRANKLLQSGSFGALRAIQAIPALLIGDGLEAF